MTFSKEEIQAMAEAVPCWLHTINLGQGVVTRGLDSEEGMRGRLKSLQLPELRGKSVLDINTLDGFYAFEAERRGASRVVAIDHYLWAMDLEAHMKYWLECKEQGTVPRPYHTMPYYKPNELPGKIGFDTAHKALGSKVDVHVADFMELDLERLGMFDVVLYLGSLYHMENPLEALRRVSKVTQEVAIIETEAVEFEAYGNQAFCEFFESNELNGDVSNWWAPNAKALTGLCRAAGFKRVDFVRDSQTAPRTSEESPGVIRYRAIVHAWKKS